MPPNPSNQQAKAYIVVCESQLATLETRVMELILKGYRPHGSLSIQEEHSEIYFYQPMLHKNVMMPPSSS
ncbi:MAG: hypothetical protein RIT27_842 [Pseudomonadota bacterium]|jgi:hypothetical protein